MLPAVLGVWLEVLVEEADAAHSGRVRGTSCRYVPVSFRGHLPALLRRLVIQCNAACWPGSPSSSS